MNMTKSHSHRILFGGLFGLALAAVASAQSVSAPPPAANSGFGLLGQNYVGVDAGYIRDEQHPRPLVRHDYGFVDNHNILQGLDFNLNYDYLTGSNLGVHDFRNTVTAGLTGYLPVTTWARPFVSAAAGWEWERSSERVVGGARDNHFTDVLGTGVEFQALPRLALTPFAAYQDIHGLEHDWTYGLKATYRLNERWSVSLIPQIDAHRNLDYMAGINLHY